MVIKVQSKRILPRITFYIDMQLDNDAIYLAIIGYILSYILLTR
jgi:hypothetical protein